MMPGINKKQMEQAMRRMGIQQQEIEAEEVIIRTADKDIIISNPDVAKVNMMGQVSFQISGQVSERARSVVPEISSEDVETVVSQTGASEEDARAAIEEAEGDLAEAIMKLKKE